MLSASQKHVNLTDSDKLTAKDIILLIKNFNHYFLLITHHFSVKKPPFQGGFWAKRRNAYW
ncbi:hypothetical protein D0C16_15160 [Cellvibrio sp. KY-GH-1]|nr:hypothetical protein D0C16_15160 [Cellvibrio sp. KY-GH-1]